MTELSNFSEAIFKATGAASFTDALESVESNFTSTAAQKLLKFKFSQFNATVEALLTHQGEWRVSSPELRELVGAELMRKIIPPYTTFFNKYSKIHFSKRHMDDYLKFPPTDLEHILKGFFK